MNQPRRTLHVIGRLDGYGGARMLRRLAPREVAGGGESIVAALAADPAIVEELEAAGVQVRLLDSRWKFDPVAIARLCRLRRRAAADLLHAWDDAAHHHLLLTSGHEPVVVERRQSGPAPTWLMRTAGHAYVTTPPGVPPAQPSQRSRQQAHAEFGLPADAALIAVAGPLLRRKRVDDAIWCFELVRILHPRARLVVFGDGPDRARLERFAAAVSEPGCVQLVGYRADLADLLPHADAYWQLNPSPSTPHALLEAMAAGVPAVASDVPAHCSAIVPDETGCLVPRGDRAEVARATDMLLTNAADAERIARNGRQYVAAKFPLKDACIAWDRLWNGPPNRRAVTLPAKMA